MRAHELERVVLITLYGCAWYGHEMGLSADGCLAAQAADVAAAADVLQGWHPSLPLDAYLAMRQEAWLSFHQLNPQTLSRVPNRTKRVRAIDASNYRNMAHRLRLLPRLCFAEDRGIAMSELSGKHHRVLVVDDNEDAATSLAILMTQVGYEVKTAFNGKTALEIAWQFEPDVCILDINMPGMSGYDLARRLREIPRGHAPILATMTAYGDVEHLDCAADAGFDLHFTKPAELNDLIDQIKDSLSRREQ